MSGHHNPQEDDLQDYPLRSASGAPILHWSPDDLYTPSPNHAQQVSPYAMSQAQPVNHPQWSMEPGQTMSDFQLSSGHLAPFIPQRGSNHPASDHSPDHAHLVYSPASSRGLYASPSLHNATASSSGHSSLPGRGSPQVLTSQPATSDSLPRDVRDAMNAAYASVEWATGANVPAEILMPTVQKLGKELWRCRICGKDHKRRDHTLTHVRTSHLDNKGFRCTFAGCDSAFGRKGDLERHISSTHQGSYEAVCPHCNSQLHRKDNLTRHIKTCRMLPARGSSSRPAYHAPYPTPSLRSHRHIKQSIASISQSHFPSINTQSSSDAFYDHMGLRLRNTGPIISPQEWYSDPSFYDPSSYNPTGYAVTAPWWM